MSALALSTAAPTARRPLRLLRHRIVLAKRNMIGVRRNPEALLDVTLQPIIFIGLFTFIFGGAVAHGSQHDYLQFLLPGILAQTIAFGAVAIGVNLNSDIEKGVFDRFRSLPIARAAPLVGEVAGARPEIRNRAVSAPVGGDHVLTDAVARINAAGIAVSELSLHLPSLDEVFFTLTNRKEVAA